MTVFLAVFFGFAFAVFLIALDFFEAVYAVCTAWLEFRMAVGFVSYFVAFYAASLAYFSF